MRTQMYNKKWKNEKKVEQGNDDYIEVKMTSHQKEALKTYLDGRQISEFVRELILAEMNKKAKAVQTFSKMHSGTVSMWH